MSDRLGSHWRWRLAMALIAIALIAYGWWQAGRWKHRVLVESGGYSAIYRVFHRDGSESVEAFDWKSGRRWLICKRTDLGPRSDFQNPVLVIQGGKAVVWRQGREVHVVDVDPPHQPRSFSLPDLPRDHGGLQVLQDGQSAIYGRWRIDGKGEWALSDKAEHSSPKFVRIVHSSPGGFRLEDAKYSPQIGETLLQGVEVRTLPDVSRVLVQDSDRFPFYLWILDTESKRLWTISRLNRSGVHIAHDARTIAISDCFDDIVIFDVLTWKVIARESSGSSRRLKLLAIGAGFLVLAFAWTRIGIKEAVMPWAMFDAFAASVLVQAAVFPVGAAAACPYLRITTPWLATLPSLGPYSFLQGSMIGGAILAGWFLSQGRCGIAVRWLLGTLWLIALVVPLACYGRGPILLNTALALRAFVIVGLIISGVTAAVATATRPLGWGIAPRAESPLPWRFRVMQMFVLVASVGLAIVLYQSLPFVSNYEVFSWSEGALVFGIPLVGLSFLRSRWMRVIGSIAALVAAAAVAHWRISSAGRYAGPGNHAGEAISTFASTLTIVIPCFVLRGRGWRWTRLQPVKSLVETPA